MRWLCCCFIVESDALEIGDLVGLGGRMMWKASTGWLAIVFLVHSVCAQKAVLKTGEQLPVGGTVGTYRLSYDLKVEFPGEAERVHCSVMRRI
jgi:hypothetical protein